MPIGAKMYEVAKESEAPEGEAEADDKAKKDKKDSKDGAVEGEVVDEK
jgi:hypothetical protein